MSSYNDFAYFYDRLTEDVDYAARTEYLCELFSKFDRMPSLLLDVACGTGSFSREFAKKTQVIGVDMSPDMLSVAQEKGTQNIMYLCQAAQELELYGTVDGAVCCLDSINHITDEDDLQAAFKRISLFLEKDRLFIFDVNTEYKHSVVLGDNTFVRETDDLFCVWQNFYDEQNKTTDISIDVFAEENGKYERFCEDFSEKFYGKEILERMLKNANLKIEAVYDENTFSRPTDKSERIVYITRKI